MEVSDMRRAASVLAGLILLIAASVVPVAADTTGGGNRLQSSTFTCDAEVCTETTVSAFLDPSDGTACLDILISDGGTFVSLETGCTPAPTFTISKTLAASFGPTSIPLQTCDENFDNCADSRTVIVSASDSPTGPVSTTSGHSTTRDGTCTTKTKFTDSSVSVAGTYTIDGVTTAETGDVSTHTEKSKTTCRF
jgi:hypothetical protein